MKFVIVGGGGYIGYHIGVDLVIKGHHGLLLDIREPDQEWVADAELIPKFVEHKIKLEFRTGNILCSQDLETAFANAHCVIHCVSYGMSGREQMPAHWNRAEEINVNGTKKVISACCTAGVPALVYTSTFNVIFGGLPIENGDESLDYFPLHRHVDHYSRTKSIAEQLVLMADGKATRPGSLLRTCALRLAGVMGPKEKRHLPRIVSLLPFMIARFGYGENLVQFSGIENIVQAHVKASLALVEKPKVLGGQAYFISDGVPINHWEYLRPLMETLGFGYPSGKIPMSMVWFVTYFCQWMHVLLHPVWDFCPVIAPAEVYKSGVTHYFSISKATRDFGYQPERPNDISKICDYYYAKKLENERNRPWYCHDVFGKFIILSVIVVIFAYFVV